MSIAPSLRCRPVMTIANGDHDRQRPDGLRRQPAAEAADAVTERFNLPERQVLVIRSSPLCPAQGGSCFVAC